MANIIGIGRYKRKFSNKCKNRIHFDHCIICCSIIFLILVSGILLFPACSQNTGFNWDKAFSKPQYLLHATSWTEIMDSGSVLGPYQEDAWFLYPNEPEGGKIDVPKQGGKTTYSIDEISGPWATPREVCQLANLMKNPSKTLWSYDLTETAGIFSCKDLLGSSPGGTKCEDRSSENLVEAPGSYPPDNCQYICKNGFGPDEKFNCKPCGDICQSKNKNEVPDAAKCIGGECPCACDTANGDSYNDHGVCVNEMQNALFKAAKESLKDKDIDSNLESMRALIPYLKNDDRSVRSLAILGFRISYTNLVNAGYLFRMADTDILKAAIESAKRDKDIWGYKYQDISK
jgi:hypothetical protein